MLTRVKRGLIMRIFHCGFTGKMRMRLQIFLFCLFCRGLGLLLSTEDCMPTLRHTNYTQVLGELILTCKLCDFFNEVLYDRLSFSSPANSSHPFVSGWQVKLCYPLAIIGHI